MVLSSELRVRGREKRESERERRERGREPQRLGKSCALIGCVNAKLWPFRTLQRAVVVVGQLLGIVSSL